MSRDAARASWSSRRGFLRRAAGGGLALAAWPSAAAGVVREELVLRPGREGDEAYWRRVRDQFPIRDGIVPMNAANLCPAPRQVIEAVAAATRDIEGDVSFQNRAKYEEMVENVRGALASYLGASPDELALVRNTSEANNIVVAGLSLGAGDEVLLFDENHATNAVAWDVRAARYGFTVRRVSAPSDPRSPEQVLEAFVSALGPRTRVLSFTDVSNTSGLRLPTAAICARARERGVYTHVDGAQTFGALVRDLHALGCDSYAASGHKWFMGPKETGILFVRSERVAELWPGVVGVGWGDGAETSARGARKFETLGQRDDARAPGLAAALRLHESIGPARVESRILELAEALKEGLAALPGARPVTPAPRELSAGVVIARFEGADHRRLHERLYAEHGIASAATGGCRLCPHVHNTMDEVERALRAVRSSLN